MRKSRPSGRNLSGDTPDPLDDGEPRVAATRRAQLDDVSDSERAPVNISVCAGADTGQRSVSGIKSSGDGATEPK